MESLGIQFGGIGVLICLMGLANRISKAQTNQSITWKLQAYLALNILLGIATVAFGVRQFPSPADYAFLVWQFGWNGASVIAVKFTPTRWSILPISYIGLSVIYSAYYVASGGQFNDPARPLLFTIMFGVIVMLYSVVALVLTFTKKPAKAE